MDLDSLIAARPANRSDLAGWYSSIFESAEASGLSVAQLSQRLSCSRETLYAWRRRLGGSATGSGTRSVPALGLVRVTVSEQASGEESDPAPHLEVRTRTGRGILVQPGFDPEQLAAVLEVLEAC